MQRAKHTYIISCDLWQQRFFLPTLTYALASEKPAEEQNHTNLRQHKLTIALTTTLIMWNMLMWHMRESKRSNKTISSNKAAKRMERLQKKNRMNFRLPLFVIGFVYLWQTRTHIFVITYQTNNGLAYIDEVFLAALIVDATKQYWTHTKLFNHFVLSQRHEKIKRFLRSESM